jgi:hypothetical protein
MESSLRRIVLLLVAFVYFGASTHGVSQSTDDTRARKFDEYVLDGEQRWTRLARFVKQLKREPKKQGLVIVYAERKIVGPGVYYDGEDWKNWVFHNMKAQGLSADRFVTVNGGLRERGMIELWLVSPGAPLPLPTPTATETIVCPSVNVLGDVWTRTHNQPLTFKIHLSAWRVYSFPKAIFNWTVSSGQILSGQGTDTISVDVSQSAHNRIEASVEVVGLSTECKNRDSATTVVAVVPYKFDAFGKIGFEYLTARVDYLALYLQNDPTLKAHIITYSGRYGRRGEAKAWSGWMKDYLVKTRGLDAARIVPFDGGFREELSGELWLVPPDTPSPKPSPTLDPAYAQPRPRKTKTRIR